MRSPQVRAALLHCTTAGYTPPRFDHKSFLVYRPVALLGSASYPILVHRLTVYVPRFLPTLGRPHAVALRFARRDQLATGLAPVGVRPCWAHDEKKHRQSQCFLPLGEVCQPWLSQDLMVSSESLAAWWAALRFSKCGLYRGTRAL